MMGPAVDASGKPLAWQFWSPRPDLEPRAYVASDREGVALKLATVDFSSFGKWMVKDTAVIPGHLYRFEVRSKLISARSATLTVIPTFLCVWNPEALTARS